MRLKAVKSSGLIGAHFDFGMILLLIDSEKPKKKTFNPQR